eukprot:NODE_3269_length_1385_cov_48.403328_g2844_i0.p1 GENE.NODE_3269_length_1385_cov_48.403328_g2844_i0~~NODE_3269_length_1385_cov_48.403328_g2844_i0.p1  ORF type:complete len:412 (+),score=57.02 NODE_3269_length_1385_cov_48.403328_g2844_i0:46-1236(+)
MTPNRDDGATQQFHNKTYKNIPYNQFADSFKAKSWDPHQWADIFAKSGARYIVLTSKHHDGYCLWNTKYSPNWNAMERGPGRDLIQELADAIRQHPAGMKFGLYYSLLEWQNQYFAEDRRNGGRKYPKEVVLPQLREIVEKYRPEVIWFDGNRGQTDEYWGIKPFLSWLYNESPVKDTVVVNDRLGDGCEGVHGDFKNCRDRFQPDSIPDFLWECCMTIGSSWGHNKYLESKYYKSSKQLIELLIRTVSKGGNLLLNVGPTEDGLIIEEETERLIQIGEWIKVNGEAIFNTVPYQPTTSISRDMAYTKGNDGIYTFILNERCFVDGSIELKGLIVASYNEKVIQVSILSLDGPMNLESKVIKSRSRYLDIIVSVPISCLSTLNPPYVLRISELNTH